jgi:hypothetical protein
MNLQNKNGGLCERTAADAGKYTEYNQSDDAVYQSQCQQFSMQSFLSEAAEEIAAKHSDFLINYLSLKGTKEDGIFCTDDGCLEIWPTGFYSESKSSMWGTLPHLFAFRFGLSIHDANLLILQIVYNHKRDDEAKATILKIKNLQCAIEAAK